MKTHIQELCKDNKWKGRECVQGLWLQMDPKNFVTDAQAHLLFLDVVLC